jgi:hypothetical protein
MCDKLIKLTVMNLVTAKAGAKHELLSNKLASGHYDTHQNDTQHKGLICNTQHEQQVAKPQCYYAEHHYTECRILFMIMLSVVMLNAVMLSVIMLSVVVPTSVLKRSFPFNNFRKKFFNFFFFRILVCFPIIMCCLSLTLRSFPC